MTEPRETTMRFVTLIREHLIPSSCPPGHALRRITWMASNAWWPVYDSDTGNQIGTEERDMLLGVLQIGSVNFYVQQQIPDEIHTLATSEGMTNWISLVYQSMILELANKLREESRTIRLAASELEDVRA